jgi:hypothetical protein
VVVESLNGAPQPICISPTKDIPYFMLRDVGTPTDLKCILDHLNRSNPDGFKDFKLLEIRDWHSVVPFGQTLQKIYLQAAACTLCFHHLEEVHIILADNYYGDETSPRVQRHRIGQLHWTDLDQSRSKSAFEEVFSWGEKELLGYKRPKISFRYWKKIEMEH